MEFLSIAGLTLAVNSPLPICTPGWREALWELSVLPKNTTRCPQPGLEPEPLDPDRVERTIHEAIAPKSDYL